MEAIVGILIAVVIGLVVFIVVKLHKPAEVVEPITSDRILITKPEPVITKDKTELLVNAFVIFEFTDKNLVSSLDVGSFEKTLFLIAGNGLRDVIGAISFDELISARDKANGAFLGKLEGFFARWKVRVIAVGIDKIEVSVACQRALHEKIYYENIKLVAPEANYIDLMKLKTLEKVADGQATKIYAPEMIDLLRAEAKHH